MDHEKKLDYYKQLLRQDQQMRKSNNEIHHGEEVEEDLVKKIKIMNKKLEEAYEILKGQVTELKANPFKHPKVRQLWAKVGL